jgi:hypothetical protein
MIKEHDRFIHNTCGRIEVTVEILNIVTKVCVMDIWDCYSKNDRKEVGMNELYVETGKNIISYVISVIFRKLAFLTILCAATDQCLRSQTFHDDTTRLNRYVKCNL